MSKAQVETLCGLQFSVQYGCYRTALPLIEIALEYRSGGTYNVTLNSVPLAWKEGQKAPSSAREAASRALAAARLMSTDLTRAVEAATIRELEDDDIVYIFQKSGSRVRIIGHAEPYQGQPCVAVRRVDTGKEMVVPRDALTPESEDSE